MSNYQQPRQSYRPVYDPLTDQQGRPIQTGLYAGFQPQGPDVYNMMSVNRYPHTIESYSHPFSKGTSQCGGSCSSSVNSKQEPYAPVGTVHHYSYPPVGYGGFNTYSNAYQLPKKKIDRELARVEMESTLGPRPRPGNEPSPLAAAWNAVPDANSLYSTMTPDGGLTKWGPEFPNRVHSYPDLFDKGYISAPEYPEYNGGKQMTPNQRGKVIERFIPLPETGRGVIESEDYVSMSDRQMPIRALSFPQTRERFIPISETGRGNIDTNDYNKMMVRERFRHINGESREPIDGGDSVYGNGNESTWQPPAETAMPSTSGNGFAMLGGRTRWMIQEPDNWLNQNPHNLGSWQLPGNPAPVETSPSYMV